MDENKKELGKEEKIGDLPGALHRNDKAEKRYKSSKEILIKSAMELMNEYYQKAEYLILRTLGTGNEEDKLKYREEAIKKYIEVVEMGNEFGLSDSELVKSALKKLEKMDENFINDDMIIFYLRAQNFELKLNHTEAIEWYKKIIKYGDAFSDVINENSKNIIEEAIKRLKELEKN